MAASYIVKERAFDGLWENPYGRGLKYTKWRTLTKFSTMEDARQKRDEYGATTGLRQRAIFYQGKRAE